MTILEALAEARETGKVTVTEETVDMLQAVAELNKAQERIIEAIDRNCPDEMDSDALEDSVFKSIYHMHNRVFAAVGDIIMKRMFIFQESDEFKGI